MNGQLWQECDRHGCDHEPVCVDCGYCATHCRCPSDTERAAWAREEDDQRRRREQIRTETLTRLERGELKPVDLRLQRGLSNGDYADVEPGRRASFLQCTLDFENAVAQRTAGTGYRADGPFADVAAVAASLVRTGRPLSYGTDWYDRLRWKPPTEEEA